VIFTCVIEAWSKVNTFLASSYVMMLIFLSRSFVDYFMSVWSLLIRPFCNNYVTYLPDRHVPIIFCIYLVQLTLQGSLNGFSSSRTSRITFVDLAGPENDDLEGAAKNSTKEERHLKKSLSRLGYVNLCQNSVMIFSH